MDDSKELPFCVLYLHHLADHCISKLSGNRKIVKLTSPAFLKGWVRLFLKRFKGGLQVFVQLLRGGLKGKHALYLLFLSLTLWLVLFCFFG